MADLAGLMQEARAAVRAADRTAGLEEGKIAPDR